MENFSIPTMVNLAPVISNIYSKEKKEHRLAISQIGIEGITWFEADLPGSFISYSASSELLTVLNGNTFLVCFLMFQPNCKSNQLD